MLNYTCVHVCLYFPTSSNYSDCLNRFISLVYPLIWRLILSQTLKIYLPPYFIMSLANHQSFIRSITSVPMSWTHWPVVKTECEEDEHAKFIKWVTASSRNEIIQGLLSEAFSTNVEKKFGPITNKIANIKIDNIERDTMLVKLEENWATLKRKVWCIWTEDYGE